MAATATQIGIHVKNMATDISVEVKIEPHATVGMLKQRIAYIAKTHEKQQILSTTEHGVLDNLKTLEELGFVDQTKVELTVPQAPKEELVVVSDDEGLLPAEADEAPALPELVERELTDKEMDEQGEFKGQAAEAMEDGEYAKALELQTKAILICPSAMMLAKRAEMLLKLKRPRGAAADATAALKMNPDSCKAYKLQGKALRLLGDYEGATRAFGQAQQIDFDDGIADQLKYVSERNKKMRAAAMQKEKAEAAAA